jgi:yeast amino acid transporter
MCITILLTSGFTVFTEGNWDGATFVSAYLDIPLVLTAYLSWKFYKKTKITKLEDIPVFQALEQAEQYPDEPLPKSEGWIQLISWLWD